VHSLRPTARTPDTNRLNPWYNRGIRNVPLSCNIGPRAQSLYCETSSVLRITSFLLLRYWHCPHIGYARSKVYASVGRLSARLSVVCCLSVPSGRRTPLRVCCCGPGGQEISIDCCTGRGRQPAVAALQHGAQRAVPRCQLA